MQMPKAVNHFLIYLIAEVWVKNKLFFSEERSRIVAYHDSGACRYRKFDFEYGWLIIDNAELLDDLSSGRERFERGVNALSGDFQGRRSR